MSSEELGGTVLKCAFLFIYVGCSESNASSFFHGNCADTKSTVTLTDKVLSLKTFFSQHSHHHQLHIFASHEQEPACHACKNPCGGLEHNSSSAFLLPLLKHATYHLTVLTATVWAP